MTRRGRRAAAVLALPPLVAAGAAWAFWTAPVAPGSSGAGAATTVGPGQRPTAQAAVNAVTVIWAPSTLADGSPVSGYRVRRYAAATGAEHPAAGGCAGVVTARSCTETVPDGRWRYTVTPVVGTAWAGAESPRSAEVLAGTGPAGGSVTVAGLTGTGSAYTTTTALPLTLDPGTDPDGVAPSGARLLRAEAPLTSTGTAAGGCGAFGAFAEVAADPPRSHTDTVPAAGRCYRHRYVVADVHGNTATVTGPEVRVDSTAPAAPALALSDNGSAAAHVAGTTLFHRPGTSGRLTVTATARDPESGVAGLGWPELDGWVATRAGTTAHYDWSAGTAASVTAGVTATNHAGLPSAAAALSVRPDGTPPTAVVSYADGATTADRVWVSVSGIADAGSGVATRQLQRAVAPLAAEGCGSFGAFEPVAHHADTAPSRFYPVRADRCYRYRVVVTDNVGNRHETPATAVVRAVDAGYADVVRAAPGLTGFWRLGEHLVARDDFDGPAGSPVTAARPGQVGLLGSFGVPAVVTEAGRLRRAGPTAFTGLEALGGIYSGFAEPDTPDYAVEALVHAASLLAHDSAAVWGRSRDTTTGYAAGYDVATGTWQLARVIGFPTWTVLASTPEQLVPGRSYRVTLDMRGDVIRLLVDGVERLRVRDSSLQSPGSGGLALGYSRGPSAAPTDATGLHVDDFSVLPHAADETGTAPGLYLGAPRLDQPSGASGDLNTSALLDGADDAVRIPTTVADDLAVELLFATAEGRGDGAGWRDGARLLELDLAGAEDLGVSVAADGRVVAGLGEASVASAPGYADGGWHHLVLARERAGGRVTLFLDGVEAGSVDGPESAVAGAAELVLGRAVDGTGHLAGRLDEVALYATALDAGTVAAHHAAR